MGAEEKRVHGLIGFRNPRPLGVVRVNWLCLEAMPWSIGVLEYWVQRIEDSVVFSILVFALLHYSITAEKL